MTTRYPLVDQLAAEPPACVDDAGSWCQNVYELTGNDWLAGSASWLVATPLKILLILVIAVVLRMVARKVIDRLATATGGRPPALLRPMREQSQAAGVLLSRRRAQRAKTIASVFKSIVSFVVFGLAFVLILGELGLNLGPIIASAGIVGVALGFGAQNLVRDFLSGVFMVLEDQYGVGDWVDVGEAAGTVEAVGLRITTLRDLNGTVWYVRNGEIVRVGNSSQDFAVAVVDVPMGHRADVARAAEILDRVAAEVTMSEAVADDIMGPPEVLGVETVSAESILIRLTVKVRPGRQWSVQRILRARAVTAFEQAGITPPLGRLFQNPES